MNVCSNLNKQIIEASRDDGLVLVDQTGQSRRKDYQVEEEQVERRENVWECPDVCIDCSLVDRVRYCKHHRLEKIRCRAFGTDPEEIFTGRKTVLVLEQHDR